MHLRLKTIEVLACATCCMGYKSFPVWHALDVKAGWKYFCVVHAEKQLQIEINVQTLSHEIKNEVKNIICIYRLAHDLKKSKCTKEVQQSN